NRMLSGRWAEAAEAGKPIEAEAQISELTLVIVLKSIFGPDYTRMAELEANPFSILTEQPERNLAFAARFHRLRKLVDSIIDRRRAEGHGESFEFLGHLLAARDRDGQAMKRNEIIDETMTLIVAGHETTASALAFAWYLIATHPEVCKRIQS